MIIQKKMYKLYFEVYDVFHLTEIPLTGEHRAKRTHMVKQSYNMQVGITTNQFSDIIALVASHVTFSLLTYVTPF